MACGNIVNPVKLNCEDFKENPDVRQRLFEARHQSWIKNVMNKLGYSREEAEKAFIRIYKRS